MTHKFVNIDGLGYVIFPRTDLVTHAEVRNRFCAIGRVVSAGFVSFTNGRPYAYGRSESCNVGSTLEDSNKMAAQLGFNQFSIQEHNRAHPPPSNTARYPRATKAILGSILNLYLDHFKVQRRNNEGSRKNSIVEVWQKDYGTVTRRYAR